MRAGVRARRLRHFGILNGAAISGPAPGPRRDSRRTETPAVAGEALTIRSQCQCASVPVRDLLQIQRTAWCAKPGRGLPAPALTTPIQCVRSCTVYRSIYTQFTEPSTHPTGKRNPEEEWRKELGGWGASHRGMRQQCEWWGGQLEVCRPLCAC